MRGNGWRFGAGCYGEFATRDDSNLRHGQCVGGGFSSDKTAAFPEGGKPVEPLAGNGLTHAPVKYACNLAGEVAFTVRGPMCCNHETDDSRARALRRLRKQCCVLCYARLRTLDD